jgi:hypothetical protein
LHSWEHEELKCSGEHQKDQWSGEQDKMAPWSRRRIRWFGEKEEDQIRSRIRAGGGKDDLGSRRKISRWFGLGSRRRIKCSGEQEEDQVVWRAGGGSDGLGTRRRIRWFGEQEEDQIV